ncbi:MAG: acyloxyacyl hydrolase [Alphaproteobacteria bacterium]
MALACLAVGARADQEQAPDDGYGLDTIAFGVLLHDAGVFGNGKEDGVDFNVELRLDKLTGEFWGYLLNPQPHIGVSINSVGDTSQAYFGLTWLFDFGAGFFGGGSLGGAVHNGETDTNRPDKKSLGSVVLFRESVEIGWRFAPRHSLSVMLDHISNAGLASENEGLDNVGIRYSLRL